MANIPGVKERIGDIGSDFSDYLKHALTPFDGMVKLHLGDITQMSYEGKIEILFLDILKTMPVFLHCNTLFMGHLVPGLSLVIQQDYYWHENWYINAYMEMLNDYFIIVDSAETSCVFLNTKAVPDKYCKSNFFTSLSSVEIVELLCNSRDRASSLFQYVMSELCIINYALGSKAVILAEARLRDFEARFGKLINEWKNRPSNRRAWGAYIEISRRAAGLRAA
jgi:hypothetical protein